MRLPAKHVAAMAFRLPLADVKALQKLARERGWTMSECARHVLQAGLATLHPSKKEASHA